MASAYFYSRSGYIHFDKRGLGPPLLLLHGIHIGASNQEFCHNLAALQKHFTVYAIDLLGFGDSDSPKMTHTAEIHQHLLRSLIAEEIGQAVSIVASGISCGIAVRLGVYDDSLVDRLALICPQQTHADRDAPALADRVSQFFLSTLAAGIGLFETAASVPSLTTFLHDRYFDPHKVTPDAVARLQQEARRPGSMYPYLSLLNGYFDVDALRWLRHVRARTLVLWGQSLGPPPVDRIRQPAAWSRGKQLQVIPQTRHWPHVEQSARTNALLIDFLNSIDPKTS